MPERSVDVAVIGGGIIGCAAAAYLADEGASVTLCERTAIGAGASGRNLGAIQHPFDPILGTLYFDSLDRYRVLAAEADAFAIADEPAGLLLLNADADAVRRQVARFSKSLPELAPAFLSAREARAAEPLLGEGLAACRLATGYPVPPDAATAAFAAAAVRRGVTVRIGSAAVPRVANGRASGVRLADGTELPAGRVLVAAGPWSPELVDPDGGWRAIHSTWGVTVQLSLDGEVRHLLEEDEVDSVNRPATATMRAASVDADGEPPSVFSLSSAAGVSTLGSSFLPVEPHPETVAELLIRRAQRFVPAVASSRRLGMRMCARPQSVDGRPFIGSIAGAAGLFVCAGHGPWGISTGPASAALAVKALLSGSDEAIPRELRASRPVPIRYRS